MKDLEKITDSMKKCREIKSEILRFGVNQLEIEQLIKNLALELEDREKMLAIISCLEEKKTGSILMPEE